MQSRMDSLLKLLDPGFISGALSQSEARTYSFVLRLSSARVGPGLLSTPPLTSSTLWHATGKHVDVRVRLTIIRAQIWSFHAPLAVVSVLSSNLQLLNILSLSLQAELSIFGLHFARGGLHWCIPIATLYCWIDTPISVVGRQSQPPGENFLHRPYRGHQAKLPAPSVQGSPGYVLYRPYRRGFVVESDI